MATYGLTPTGFVRKPLEVILADIEARQRATIAEDIDQSPESVLGQNNGILAREISLGWEALEDVYNSFDPDSAEDTSLVNLSKLTGTEKRDASYSIVVMTVNLDIGTLLESGVHFVASSVDADVRFTPEADYTAPSTGAHDVTFRAETKGPIAAGAGDLTVIATPVTGWNSATNSAAAIPGRDVDTNEILRTRREEQIAAAGSSTLDSLAADVFEVSEDIEDVLPFENETSVTDGNGLPPHSFELVIWDQGLVSDDLIAQKIWDNRPAGIRSFGSESGTAEDANGDDQTVSFSRFTERQVYVEYDLEVGPDFNATVFKSNVVTGANLVFTGNKDVLFSRLNALALEQDNVEDVVAVRLGFASNPTLSANLPIGIREIARFATARIDVTEV